MAYSGLRLLNFNCTNAKQDHSDIVFGRVYNFSLKLKIREDIWSSDKSQLSSWNLKVVG